MFTRLSTALEATFSPSKETLRLCFCSHIPSLTQRKREVRINNLLRTFPKNLYAK